MARHVYIVLLACLVCIGYGRRVQTLLEETYRKIHPAGDSRHDEFQAQSTHLFAQPSSHVFAPSSSGIARSSTPTLGLHAKPQLVRSTAKPAMIKKEDEQTSDEAIPPSWLPEWHDSRLEATPHGSGKSGDSEAGMIEQVLDSAQKEQLNAEQEKDMPASSPSFVVFLNYIWLAFIGMMQAAKPKGDVLQRINRVSNVASILCAIDCTVFPLLLTVMPLVSAVSTGGATAWLHRASHACALWFVAPVGGMAVATNWMQHKRSFVGLWGLCGISAILLANIHLPHVILGWHVPAAIDHTLHAWHTTINVSGCVLLLSSQRYAHKLVHCGDCGHDHGHVHGPNCKH